MLCVFVSVSLVDLTLKRCIESLCVCVYVCRSLSLSAFSLELKLKQRIEYLSRASICAKSSTAHTSVPGDGEFLHELEEKMEVRLGQITVT